MMTREETTTQMSDAAINLGLFAAADLLEAAIKIEDPLTRKVLKRYAELIRQLAAGEAKHAKLFTA
jgi:hypothetical protein